MISKDVLKRLWRRGQAKEVPRAISEDTTRLGAAAKRLLDDPVLRLAFELLEDDVVRAWGNTVVADREKREVLYHQLFALHQISVKLNALLGQANLLAAEEARRAENPELWAA